MLKSSAAILAGALVIACTTFALPAASQSRVEPQKRLQQREDYQPNFPAYPVGSAEPVKLAAKVAFVSDGTVLLATHCKLLESSGDPEADSQACHTVQFFKTSPGTAGIAMAPVWSTPPVAGDFTKPVAKNGASVSGRLKFPIGPLERDEQGTVTMRLHVLKSGKVAGCEVMQSSGSSSIDEAICLAGRKLRYSAGLLDGQPIDTFIFASGHMYQGNGPPKSR